MPLWLLCLLVAVSAGTWIYSKFSRTTGGNQKTSLIAAGVSTAFIFLVVYSVASLFD